MADQQMPQNPSDVDVITAFAAGAQAAQNAQVQQAHLTQADWMQAKCRSTASALARLGSAFGNVVSSEARFRVSVLVLGLRFRSRRAANAGPILLQRALQPE